jgi:hypothetical protein
MMKYVGLLCVLVFMIGSLGSPITNDCKTLSVITEPDIEYPIGSFNDEYYFQDW